MNHSRIYAAGGVAAAVIGAWLIYPVLVGGSSRVPDSQLQEIVYVDTETGDAFLLRARSSVEANPETDKRTLVPGMYCAQCKAWKPVGPMDKLQNQRNARNCPVHKSPLSREGPLPDEQDD